MKYQIEMDKKFVCKLTFEISFMGAPLSPRRCSAKDLLCKGDLNNRPEECPLIEVVEEGFDYDLKRLLPLTPSPKTHPEERNHLNCYYCGLTDEYVEAGGLWYCPNKLCTGPGNTNYVKSLDCGREVSNGYIIEDLAKLVLEANKEIRKDPMLFKKILELYPEDMNATICTTEERTDDQS